MPDAVPTAKVAQEAPTDSPPQWGSLRAAEVPAPRDIRASRPYLLSALLNRDIYRRAARLVTLLLLDISGVYLGIFSGLALKGLARGEFAFAEIARTTADFAPLACTVVVLLFAGRGL